MLDKCQLFVGRKYLFHITTNINLKKKICQFSAFLSSIIITSYSLTIYSIRIHQFAIKKRDKWKEEEEEEEKGAWKFLRKNSQV